MRVDESNKHDVRYGSASVKFKLFVEIRMLILLISEKTDLVSYMHQIRGQPEVLRQKPRYSGAVEEVPQKSSKLSRFVSGICKCRRIMYELEKNIRITWTLATLFSSASIEDNRYR